MDPTSLKAIVEQAVRDGLGFSWWIWLVTFVLAAVGAYLGSYLREKAKNLATKEDVTGLTELVETVRRQHAERLETFKKSLTTDLEEFKISRSDLQIRKSEEFAKF
jgi:hypothetical protein